MAGWLDKYDDAIIAQGGETIPLSREDYLRQQYQNYLKSQAEKGRKAVVEGREKFAKDYVIPAIKTAASFTPAGPLIGLADAYNAYQEGNTGWAIAGAGLEALPYAGKIVGKAAPIAKTVAKNLKKDNLKILIYNNISPVGYTGKKQEIKNLIRDIKYIDNPTIHNNPIRSEIVSGPHSNDFYGLDPQVANRNRNDAWKLYLGIDDKGKSLYIPTNKKDVYRYNPNRISDEATHNFLNQRFDEGQDLLTSNAGGVGRIKTVPSNLPDVQFAKMRDTWDLQPFKDASRSLLSDLPYSDKFIFNPDRVSYRKWVPDKLKNLEIGEFLGVGKPFTVEHSIPYKTSLSYTKHPNRNWWEQFGENIDTPKFIRNRVTDRIVYEKPDYDELIKDIYNKKFDKTFQKGGTIKEPTLHEAVGKYAKGEVEKWLTTRYNTGRFEDQLGDDSSKNLDKQLHSLRTVKPVKSWKELRDHSIDAMWKQFTPLAIRTIGIDNFNNMVNNAYPENNDAPGAYSEYSHTMFANPGKSIIPVMLHEATHSLGAYPQQDKIKELISRDSQVNNRVNHSDIDWNYMDNPEEIYSRMMEFRLQNHLDPKKIWRKEDLPFLKKINADSDMPTGILDLYDDDTVLKLLNEIAENKVESKNNIPQAKYGGIIPKAQEGKKVKKSVIFAESPKIEEGQPQYEIYNYHSQLPPSLNNLREKYKDLRKRADELYSTTESHRNYLINYLKGYTGKDVYSVNSNNTYYARDDDGYGRTYSTEEFKDFPPLKKYNELQKELDENYYPSLIALENEFRYHPDNTTGDRVSDVFQVEGNKLREWYKKKGEELSVIPIYGIQDTSKVNAALKDVDLQDVGIMGHSGEILGGIPLEWWNNKLKDAEYRNCVLGSCYGDNLLPLLPDVKNIYHTTENQWYGVNPSADSLENALFSTQEETKIKPIKGRDYNISNKYKTGGNVSYTPEYINQLKRFENRPDNLAYHRDNKGIPTIGWGHRITEEELKRKAIKMGNEWVPYERFSGKEGRILADKLMEQDVSHHYSRLERQVGKDTLSTLPPEVQDVLLDITYNRGSLGDSLEYVKKGDIAGLRDYLAETSKGLKGGAKTRMEWRANRIPVKTLPPVERPIEYNTKDQYVPEVLRSIAEQPSTQSIIPIQDNEGYRNPENYGKPVQITSNESRTPISMDQVPFPILAMSDTGELKIMMPGEEHTFEGGSVTELPMGKKGGKYQKGGEIDPVLNEVKDAYNFIKSYHYSPKFEERYRNMYANDLLYNTKHEDHFIDYYSNIIPTIQNPQFKKEYEDQLRYYQKERDESLKKLDEKVDLSVSTARNKLKDLSFFTLRGEERQPWSDRIIRSFKGRPNPEGVETGSHYNIANNIAFIYKDQLKDGYGNPGSIAAHEFSHAVSSHIPYSIDMILKQSKMLTDPRDEHDVAFDETKSDIDALRYLLNKNKIYDTRTQDFTKEHLQRAKKTIKDFSFDRLQRLYNDDDLIELMNIIAANDNDKKEPVTIAKKGIVVKSNQLRTFTKDSGWLSKYKEL